MVLLVGCSGHITRDNLFCQDLSLFPSEEVSQQEAERRNSSKR
ncbi:unnamed protein product [Musa acuminata var. zebrina]